MYVHGEQLKSAVPRLHTPECRRYAERCVHSRKMYKGKALLEKVGHLIRTAFFAEEDNEDRPFAVDYVWYLWCGKDSPAFDKDKMATFERYFLKEKELHKEVKGHYYSLRNEEKVCDMLLDEFGVIGTHRHIINGHVPVKPSKVRIR